MSRKRLSLKNPRVQQALAELQEKILSKYPAATFRVGRDPEEPAYIDLWVTVDIDEPFEVRDLVSERLFEFDFEEGIHICLLATWPLERTIEQLRREGRLPAA